MAATPHATVVSQNAADHTPQLVPTLAVGHPRVDAITSPADGTGTVYAGGLFNKVTSAGVPYDVSNLVAFDANTGQVVSAFGPQFNKAVRAVENAPGGGVYVGGDFTSVNGVPRPGLVKLTATGQIDTTFKPAFTRGLVYDIEFEGGRLIVAGNMSKKLMSLNPSTGANDNTINLDIAGEACNTSGSICSWGITSVYDFAVSSGRLVAVGNFATVNGTARSRFFMVDLSNGSLMNWYYDSFATPCATNADRRVANLQGVDWSPNGQYFNVTATGQIPEETTHIWHVGDGPQPAATVCDGVGRFALANDTKAEWINYTGGDSVWTVQDTGAAVYVQGHFKWVDNPDGFGSQCPIGDVCARRSGIAAIDPTTGTALSWSPAVPTRMGGKALEATATGLWVGSDSTKFGAEAHYGLAFAPE